VVAVSFSNIEVSYLIERVVAYPGVTILAANRKEHIDDAFLRRLRYHVSLPPA
jgi:hypothetical protein